MFQMNLLFIPIYDHNENISIEVSELFASLIYSRETYTFRNKFHGDFDERTTEKSIKKSFSNIDIFRIQNWIINLVCGSIQYFYRFEKPKMEYTKKAILLPCKLLKINALFINYFIDKNEKEFETAYKNMNLLLE